MFITPEEVLKMAEKSGVAFSSDEYPDIWQTYMHVGKKELETFAKLVMDKAAEREREACAQVCENMACDEIYCQGFANAIRARQPLQNKPIDVGYYCVTCDRLILADGPCLASQLEQEPRAWINWSALTGEPRLGWECESELASEPLYDTPPQRKPLTHQEIVDLCDGTLTTWEQVRIARAIEAAHGIKEKNT